VAQATALLARAGPWAENTAQRQNLAAIRAVAVSAHSTHLARYDALDFAYVAPPARARAAMPALSSATQIDLRSCCHGIPIRYTVSRHFTYWWPCPAKCTASCGAHAPHPVRCVMVSDQGRQYRNARDLFALMAKGLRDRALEKRPVFQAG
jgi:hypothetical protein